jgi:S1-C subfamily serine protease
MWPWVLGVGAVVVLLVALLVTRRSNNSASLTPEQVASTVHAAVTKGLADAATAPPDSAKVYQTIQPSIVVINATRTSAGSTADSGAGVIVNTQGLILTARHVVANASSIQITFADGTKATGKIVSQQPQNDIAVLSADHSPSVIVPAVIGGAGLQVGDAAFAVGHPLGLVDSLSAGVISGLNRSVPVVGGSTLNGLIQFDAAVNPGNSGGPLLNRNGHVVGIVTALANPSQQGFFIGIGFAVPIGAAAGGAGGPEQ